MSANLLPSKERCENPVGRLQTLGHYQCPHNNSRGHMHEADRIAVSCQGRLAWKPLDGVEDEGNVCVIPKTSKINPHACIDGYRRHEATRWGPGPSQPQNQKTISRNQCKFLD